MVENTMASCWLFRLVYHKNLPKNRKIVAD
jgi:hypothetical protein